LAGARVLVVAHNAVNRAILLEQITSWNFDAAAACSGREALAVIEAAARQGIRIDCVVLDYHMPEMNGAAVAAAISQIADAQVTPVVMLTSVDQAGEGRSFLSPGVAAHLVKPARSALLLDTIVEVITEAAARREGNFSNASGIAAARLLNEMRTKGMALAG
jgi:CheY-like chemotaxis protein